MFKYYKFIFEINSLGLACSVKMVGLFSVAYIGLAKLNNLWNVLGDLRNSMVNI